MNNLKRVLSILLCMVLMAGLLSATVSATPDGAPVVITMGDVFTIQPDDGQINQFPNMYKSGDNIYVNFSKHLDGAIKGGLNGMRISRDNGKTFPEYYESTSSDFIPGGMIELPTGQMYYVSHIAVNADGEHEFVSMVSDDDGVTWTKQVGTISVPQGELYVRTGAQLSSVTMYGIPIFEDGVMYNSMYGQLLEDLDGGVASAVKWRVLWAKSEDYGKNWEIVSTIASGTPPIDTGRELQGYAEPCVTRCADGSLLAVMRTRTGEPLVQCRSYDDGLTWSVPTRLPGTDGWLSDSITGSVDPKLLMMENGLLVLCYGRPDVKLLVSTDGCGYQWDYFTTVYDDPTDGSQCSGMTGIVETEPGTLLICSDTGAVAYNPPVQSIWGRFVYLETDFPQEAAFDKAMIDSSFQTVDLQRQDQAVPLLVFDECGRLMVQDAYTVEWSSSAPDVAVVENGVLKPQKTGTAEITAEIRVNGAVCAAPSVTINVVDGSIPTALKISVPNPYPAPGEQGKIIAWTENALGEKNTEGVQFTFEAEDPRLNLAEDGQFTAGDAAGTIEVTVTASKGAVSLEETVSIVVVEDAVEPIDFESGVVPDSFLTVFPNAAVEMVDGNAVLAIRDTSSASTAHTQLNAPRTESKLFEADFYFESLNGAFVLAFADVNGYEEYAYQIQI